MRRPLLAALALTAAAGGVRAQGLGDPLLTATISQSAVADSNYTLDDPSPGTSYYADTRLLLGLLSQTPTQTFELGLDTGLRALWQAEEDFDFTFASPSTATLGYAQEWAGAEVGADLRYRQTEVDSDRPLEDFDDEFPDALDRTDVEVTERRYDGSFTLDLATDSPSSYSFSADGTRIDYDDTSTDLVPRTFAQGEAMWQLRVTPVLSAALLGAYYYYDAENVQETEIRTGEIDAGVIYEPSDVLRLDVGLGYADRSKREFQGGERVYDDRSGLVVRGALRYEFDDVVVNASARYTDSAVGSPFSGFVRATYPLPRGEISGQIFQRKGGATTGGETDVTGAIIGVEHEINTISALSFDFSASRQKDRSEPIEPDITRMDFTAAYSRALTEVVAANIGYRYRTYDQDPDDADSNSVFFEIARTFQTRP